MGISGIRIFQAQATVTTKSLMEEQSWCDEGYIAGRPVRLV